MKIEGIPLDVKMAVELLHNLTGEIVTVSYRGNFPEEEEPIRILICAKGKLEVEEDSNNFRVVDGDSHAYFHVSRILGVLLEANDEARPIIMVH